MEKKPQVLGLCEHGNDGNNAKEMVKEGEDDELELGLGLSLGGGGVNKGNGKNLKSYGRILTAKDLTNGFSCGNKRERSATAGHDHGSSSAAAAVSQVVGWPPIRSYRMSTLFSQPKTSSIEEKDEKRNGVKEDNENSNKKMNHGNEKIDVKGFVKVNMDGLAIGRKVDLNAQKSYETLAKTLEDMFFTAHGGRELSAQAPPPKLLDASSEFVLTYEDKEGDWMLLGDVPWRMFLNTVRRLRIMRTSEANGLGPKLQERNEKQTAKPI